MFGSIGRLVPSKGYDLAIEALAPQLRDGATFVLAGSGIFTRSPREPCAPPRRRGSRAVSRRTHRYRTRSLSTFDVFVSASARGEETFGLSSVEAIAEWIAPGHDVLSGARRHRRAAHRALRSHRAAALGSATRSVLGDTNRSRTAPDAVLAPFRIEQVVRAIDASYEGLSREKQGRRAGTIGAERRRASPR